MGLDDPAVKMSKSIAVTRPGHAINLLDDERTIKKAVMSAVTDSGRDTRFATASPGVRNLLSLHAVLTGLPMDEVLHLRWDFVPAAEVPRDDQAQADWLYERWADIDAWIAARAAGLEVLGLSLVTNAAAGITGQPLDHAEVLEAGRAAATRMGDLLSRVVPRI